MEKSSPEVNAGRLRIGECSVHMKPDNKWNFSCGERAKRATVALFAISGGPAKKSPLRGSLTSRPSACGRLDSTSCLLGPSLGLAPTGTTPAALFKIAPGNFVAWPAIHGGLTLFSGLRFADFSGGQQPRTVSLCASITMYVSTSPITLTCSSEAA